MCVCLSLTMLLKRPPVRGWLTPGAAGPGTAAVLLAGAEPPAIADRALQSVFLLILARGAVPAAAADGPAAPAVVLLLVLAVDGVMPASEGDNPNCCRDCLCVTGLGGAGVVEMVGRPRRCCRVWGGAIGAGAGWEGGVLGAGREGASDELCRSLAAAVTALGPDACGEGLERGAVGGASFVPAVMALVAA